MELIGVTFVYRIYNIGTVGQNLEVAFTSL